MVVFKSSCTQTCRWTVTRKLGPFLPVITGYEIDVLDISVLFRLCAKEREAVSCCWDGYCMIQSQCRKMTSFSEALVCSMFVAPMPFDSSLCRCAEVVILVERLTPR